MNRQRVSSLGLPLAVPAEVLSVELVPIESLPVPQALAEAGLT